MSEKPWKPSAVGDLFMLVNKVNSTMRLMRVTEIADEGQWRATSADIDDAMRVTFALPHVDFMAKQEDSE